MTTPRQVTPPDGSSGTKLLRHLVSGGLGAGAGAGAWSTHQPTWLVIVLVIAPPVLVWCGETVRWLLGWWRSRSEWNWLSRHPAAVRRDVIELKRLELRAEPPVPG